MKRQLIFLMITAMTFITANAQLPEKAEDISPLLIGETVPDAVLTAPDGTKKELKNLTSEKPTILLFYRGGWCPYCNAHLADIQGAEDEIIALGYKILAISPDSPENLKLTSEKDKLNYSLYSDANGKLIKSMGLAFQAPGKYKDFLNKKSDGKNEGFLPVPSVFVLNTSGLILFEYINPDYSTRMSSGLLLAVLKALNDE